MKLNKIFMMGALAALTLGFASCNSDKNQPNNINQNDADTYVGVSVKFPAATQTRTLPDDYRNKGEWEGRDDIQTIKVYVVTDEATINSTSFTKSAFNNINGGVLTPNLAVEAKSGQKVKAYVVINDIKGKVTTELDKLGAAEFDAKFASTVVKVTKVSDVATSDGTNDVVVMTNDVTPVGITVKAGVPKEKARDGVDNYIQVNVDRVVARGIVTQAQNITKEISIKRSHTVVDNSTGTPTTSVEETETAKVTITDIKYQVTGSALQFNVLKDAKDWKAPADVYDFAPATDWTTTTDNAAKANIMTYTDEGSWQTPTTQPNNELESVQAALAAEKFSKFVLPVTHAEANYKKGNTTMFEVKATFTVDKVDGVPNSNVQTVYFGLSDGLFYSTKEKAQMMDKDFKDTVTSPKQEVKKYENCEMYYYIWLNPDVLYSNVDELIKKSPTVRNHIYNAHITGFKEMGVASKEEIKPGEDLETEKTHLSVEIKVLPWTIHSYNVDLSNRY